MTSITIRNIPDEVIELVKTMAKTDKRSINNELVLLIERGIDESIKFDRINEEYPVSKETQLRIWNEISGKWDDNRSTSEIIEDIYKNRTAGREIHL